LGVRCTSRKPDEPTSATASRPDGAAPMATSRSVAVPGKSEIQPRLRTASIIAGVVPESTITSACPSPSRWPAAMRVTGPGVPSSELDHGDSPMSWKESFVCADALDANRIANAALSE
jgi:hypothetical protein